jgi:adenylyltransferase/sulfurtransferase
LQAIEVIKEVVGMGESLGGRLLIYDALSTAFRTVKITPDPACALCGTAPRLKDLSVHLRASPPA